MTFAYVTTYSARWGDRRHPDGRIYAAHTLTVHTRTCSNLPKRMGYLTNSVWALQRVLQDEPKWQARQGLARYLPCPRCIVDREGMLTFLAACRTRLDEIEAEQADHAAEAKAERRQVAAKNAAATFRSNVEQGARSRAEARLRETYPLTYARLLSEERMRSRIAMWLNAFGYCVDYRPIDSGMGTYCAYCKGTAANHVVAVRGGAA